MCVWSICFRWSGFSHICALIFGTEMRASKGPEFRVIPHPAHLPFGDILAAVGLTVRVFPMLVLLSARSALDALSPALLLKQCASGDGGFSLSLSLVMPLWAAPCEQKRLLCHASHPHSTGGGSFPCIDAFLFLVVAGRGAFQEGDEEARLNGLKSGFIIFFFIILGGKAWELFLSNCFQMVLLEHKDF